MVDITLLADDAEWREASGRMPFNALTDIPDRPFAVNERAAKVMGSRPTGIPIDQPCELGYHCPVCEYPQIVDGEYDERLLWSEYNGFLWCAVCNVDYPSALCHGIEPSEWTAGAIDVFLASVEMAVARDRKLRGLGVD